MTVATRALYIGRSRAGARQEVCMSIPKSLVEAVRKQRVVPFVGAGVSVGVKPGLFPAWRSLLEQLPGFMEGEAIDEEAVQCVRDLVAANDLVRAAEVGYRALGAYLFHGFLRDQYRQRRPADANLDVVRAIWALRPPLVITTNYDSVLRWAGPAEVQIVANDQSEELALLGEASSEWPWIWHLHGTIERMATVILADRDYKRLYEKDERNRVGSYERALFELQKTLTSRSLLYIGFGLTDPYVLEQLDHVLELTRGNAAPSYALMKQGQGNRADLRQNSNVHLVEYEDHGAPLAALLQDIARAAFGQTVQGAASGGPAAAMPPPGMMPAPAPAPAPMPRSRPMPDAWAAIPRDEATRGRGEPEPALPAQDDEPDTGTEVTRGLDPALFPMGSPQGQQRSATRTERTAKPAPAAAPAPPLQPALSFTAPAMPRDTAPAMPRDTASAMPRDTAPAIASELDMDVDDEITSEPVKPIIRRTRLVEELGGELRRGRRLLLLAPQGGGVRRLAAQIAEDQFGDRVTWLDPPRVPDCTEAEYCRFLAGGERVESFAALLPWLEERARAAGGDPLVALRHDGGPRRHLERLGDSLGALIDEPGIHRLRIHVLVAGQATAARLRLEARELSLFSGAPVRHVPAFTVDEVVQVLDLAGRDGARWGRAVWQATGGLPGLVVEALSDDDLDHASVTARLARSTAVHGRLRRRVLDDDRARVPVTQHARAVLAALLKGRAVRRLDAVADQLEHAEVRLYYDGLVVADARGETRFLCDAVQRAAAALLAQEAALA
jgi:hypothetical protein